jgi:hypothetical protein
MKHTPKDLSPEEQKVQQKIQRRESKKRKRMPVSGKSVFTIKKIIEQK